MNERISSQDAAIQPGNRSARAGRITASFGRRLTWLLAGLALFLVAGLGAGAWRVYRIPNRDVPQMALEGVDFEVVEAIEAARRKVERSPRSGKSWGQLGIVLQAHAFEDQADVCYAVAAEFDPRNPTWPHLRGFLLMEGYGDNEAAIAQLKKAANLSAPNSMARLRLADAFFELGQLEEADQEYRRLLASDNFDATALWGLGRLAVERKDYQGSLRFLQPIADDPLVQRRVSAALANVYAQLGQPAAANRERQRLTELPQESPRSDDPVTQIKQAEVGLAARLSRAQALWRQGQTQEVIELLRETLALHPESDLAWHNLGMALNAAGEGKEAVRSVEKCIELSPKSASYRRRLGVLLAAQGRHQEAVAAFQKVVELHPYDGEAHFELGESLRAVGDSLGAEQAYRAAIRLSADPSAARQRLESLREAP